MILDDQCLELAFRNNVTMGNGICDSILNHYECDFDGGDCVDYNSKYPLCSAPIPSNIGDGTCHDMYPYNTEECGYDGGDCTSAILPCNKSCTNNQSLIGIMSSVAITAILCLFFARRYHKRRIQEVSDAAYLSNSRHSIRYLEEPESKEREMKRREHIIGKIQVTQVDDDSKHTARGSSSLESSHQGSEECCPICYQTFEFGDEIVRSLNKLCIHEYHKDCVLPWLLKSDECPMCRASFLDSCAIEDV